MCKLGTSGPHRLNKIHGLERLPTNNTRFNSTLNKVTCGKIIPGLNVRYTKSCESKYCAYHRTQVQYMDPTVCSTSYFLIIWIPNFFHLIMNSYVHKFTRNSIWGVKSSSFVLEYTHCQFSLSFPFFYCTFGFLSYSLIPPSSFQIKIQYHFLQYLNEHCSLSQSKKNDDVGIAIDL